MCLFSITALQITPTFSGFKTTNINWQYLWIGRLNWCLARWLWFKVPDDVAIKLSFEVAFNSRLKWGWPVYLQAPSCGSLSGFSWTWEPQYLIMPCSILPAWLLTSLNMSDPERERDREEVKGREKGSEGGEERGGGDTVFFCLNPNTGSDFPLLLLDSIS